MCGTKRLPPIMCVMKRLEYVYPIERCILHDVIINCLHRACNIPQVARESLGLHGRNTTLRITNVERRNRGSGYVILQRDPYVSCRQFGEPNVTMNEMREAFPDHRTRVQVSGTWLYIGYPVVTFLVDAHDQHQLAILQDTLASICEAVNETAVTITALTELRERNTFHCQEIGQDVLSLSEQLKDLSRKLNEKQSVGSEHLIGGLAALFPVIGLEADQEEQILDLVESYAQSVGESVSSQVACTDQIQASLHKIMRFLAQQLKERA